MTRVRSARSRDGGFTLIEVLMALLLLLVGVAGVLTMQITSMRASAFSRNATEATVVGEDLLEELSLTDAAALVDGTDQVNAQGVADADGQYTRTWTVVADASTITITVSIAWSDGSGDPHSISMATQRSL